MKPTKSIYILLSLFLIFSCEDNTQTNEHSDDMMSLDWILLMKSVGYESMIESPDESENHFNVESCEGYVELNVDTYDEYVGFNCSCNDNYDDECGGCRLNTRFVYRVNSCSGYELCEYKGGSVRPDSQYDCCFETVTTFMDDFGNPIEENVTVYYYVEYLFNEYILLWNDDLSVSYVFPSPPHVEPDFDIVIPSYFPKDRTSDCDNGDCEDVSFFHPNCDTPIDTTMMIGIKSISFEKMGWLNRDVGNSLGYIHYYPLDDYLLTNSSSESLTNIDLSNYIIVDYQRKE